MIVLRPDDVVFDGDTWDGVVRVSIDRISTRTIEGHDETGAFATLVDVARQRVLVRVIQEIVGEDLSSPVPGAVGELELMTSHGSDAGRTRVRCVCVVETVQHRVSDYGATRSITLIGQSESGDEDPVVVTAL